MDPLSLKKMDRWMEIMEVSRIKGCLGPPAEMTLFIDVMAK